MIFLIMVFLVMVFLIMVFLITGIGRDFDIGGKNNCLPISGSEPRWEPKEWNNKYNEYFHNCYEYVLNKKDVHDIMSCKLRDNVSDDNLLEICDDIIKKSKLQPGNNVKPLCNEYNNIIQRELNAINTTALSKCPPNTSKIGLAIAKDKDYHFYRQDSNGLWSHKPGLESVTNKDSNNKLITDPSKAGRSYPNISYNRWCGWWCIPRK